ncbi:MFS transporter [Rhodoferax sp.]|uniref:MFS transporter n=1 Tax=Rhodoferax sp. TaxID=50421 RepID=UPI00271E4722|nr:MFS transporter [Rhodoferax sp.]MDO9198256.1 MFS transporter [Rhodoferax sp.]
MISAAHHVPLPVPLKQDATIIGLVGLAHASSHFAHLLLPLMFPVFMKEFGLSYSELGLLMTTFFVVSGLGQASAGFVVDRLGARPLLFVALGIFVVACSAASMVNGYSGLLAVAALAGLGNATFHPVDFTILNQRVSAPRLGHAFSAHGLTGNLGWAAAPLFFATISSLYSWRTAYLAAAAMYVGILLLLILHRDKLKTQVVRRHADVQTEHDLAFMKLPVVWWCFGFFLLSTMTLAVVQSFSVSILKAMHGVSFEAATFTLTAYMLCGAVGMFVGGFIAARTANSDRVVAIAMGVAAVLLALCGMGIFGAMGTMVVLAGTGFAVGIGGPSRDMMIKKATPKGATGRVYGMVYSGLDVGFAISPILFGVFMDRGWYGATLFGAATVLLLSVVAALGVGRRTSGRTGRA